MVAFWVKLKTGIQGPFNKSQLKALMDAGRVSEGTLVAQSEDGPWQRLSLKGAVHRDVPRAEKEVVVASDRDFSSPTKGEMYTELSKLMGANDFSSAEKLIDQLEAMSPTEEEQLDLRQLRDICYSQRKADHPPSSAEESNGDQNDDQSVVGESNVRDDNGHQQDAATVIVFSKTRLALMLIGVAALTTCSFVIPLLWLHSSEKGAWTLAQSSLTKQIVALQESNAKSEHELEQNKTYLEEMTRLKDSIAAEAAFNRDEMERIRLANQTLQTQISAITKNNQNVEELNQRLEDIQATAAMKSKEAAILSQKQQKLTAIAEDAARAKAEKKAIYDTKESLRNSMSRISIFWPPRTQNQLIPLTAENLDKLGWRQNFNGFYGNVVYNKGGVPGRLLLGFDELEIGEYLYTHRVLGIRRRDGLPFRLPPSTEEAHFQRYLSKLYPFILSGDEKGLSDAIDDL